MVRVWIVDTNYDVNGRRIVQAVLQWGGTESLNPKDVGLETIDSILLTPQFITAVAGNQAIPIGSVPTNLGSQNPQGYYRGGNIGSTVTLRWAAGSTGTRLANTQRGLGTVSTGTKTAHAQIWGQGY